MQSSSIAIACSDQAAISCFGLRVVAACSLEILEIFGVDVAAGTTRRF